MEERRQFEGKKERKKWRKEGSLKERMKEKKWKNEVNLKERKKEKSGRKK